ncbi:MAG: DUF4294 domain-containing protein [Sphingobacteriales bacterium]|nr:MAG: DUF4294 domain-containing protein [Sphingobacteriales bacterium]
MQVMRPFLIAVLLLLISAGLYAQEADTLYSFRLKDHQVKESRKWASNKERYAFNQTRHYVETILPYLNAATGAFNELRAAVNAPGLSKKERKRIIAEKEQQIKDQFEKDVKSMNVTQGRLLMTLISRQTGMNVYAMLQEFKNPVMAVKWLAWARVNGFNLNRNYNPWQEPLLESVMMSLDYPLPDFYVNQAVTQTP